jgi:hypothetical protein
VKGITWNVNFNFTKNKSNVDKVTDDQDEILKSTGATNVVLKKIFLSEHLSLNNI